MTLQMGLPTRHFNAYHQNDGLLFQFILSEFLEAYRETRILALKRHSLGDLKIALVKLAGSSLDQMRLFPRTQYNGMLTKLKIYCSLFSQNADSSEKEPIAMQYYADKAWLYCTEALDILNEVREDYTSLVGVVEKACSALQRFARLIVRLFPQFRDDENVIFFILRHHEQFDSLYGSKFVTKLFCRMYSKGLKETGHFLNKKYSHRGFDNLLALVSAKISELEAATHDDIEKTVC